MACATAGLVLGSVLGGPLAEYLVRRHEADGPSAMSTEGDNADSDPITTNREHDGQEMV